MGADADIHSPKFAFPLLRASFEAPELALSRGKAKWWGGGRGTARWCGGAGRLFAAEAGGGDFGLDVVDPHRGAGLRTGEVLQLPGRAPDGEDLAAEVPDVAIGAESRMSAFGMTGLGSG